MFLLIAFVITLLIYLYLFDLTFITHKKYDRIYTYIYYYKSQ